METNMNKLKNASQYRKDLFDRKDSYKIDCERVCQTFIDKEIKNAVESYIGSCDLSLNVNDNMHVDVPYYTDSFYPFSNNELFVYALIEKLQPLGFFDVLCTKTDYRYKHDVESAPDYTLHISF